MTDTDTALQTALSLLERGLWPIPIYPRGVIRDDRTTEGKEPIGAKWGLRRNTPETIRKRFTEYPEAGVGIGLGPGRGPDGEWLADVEGDGPEAEESRTLLFGGETIRTMGWWSTRGIHGVLTVDPLRIAGLLKPLKSLEGKGLKTGVYHLPEFPGIEIRFGGFKSDGTVKQVQSVVPPTMGTDGVPRRWNGVETIAPAPESLYTALASARVKGPSVLQILGESSLPRDSPDDVELAAEMLRALPQSYCEDYETWFEVGCSLRKLGGDGLTLWDQWSRGSEKYRPGVCAAKWGTIGIDTGIGFGSLVAWAKQYGWKGSAGHRPSQNGHQNGHQNGDATPKAPAPLERTPVEINTDRHVVLSETLAVLPNDPGLFCRGNTLVKIAEPCTDEEDRLHGGVVLKKAKGSVRIVPVGESGLSCRLTSIIEFYSFVKDKNGEATSRPVHPPTWLIKAVVEHSDYPGVRMLEGVAEIPFPRPDGTLVTTPGYDPVTGFYYSPSVVIKPIADRPSQDDARAAAAVLLALVDQFPFASPDDRPVWLAFVLTVIARPAISGPVPGTAFNGNKAGTGKGKLIDAGSMIANGRAVPTTSYPKDEAEAEKIKVAFALAGTPIAHLDNIDEGKTYGGGVIDSALTSTECGGRILGLSKNVEGIVLRTIWCLSGNNISPVKDAFRRWLVCNLATKLERPEERSDLEISDLAEYVLSHRPELVRAALVILRAHAVAGRPNGGWAPLGSYELWDRVVRGAVWFATGLDCNATRRRAADDSQERQNKLALLEAWKELPAGGHEEWGVSSAEAVKMAFGEKEKAASHPDLAGVLIRFGRDGKVGAGNIGNIIKGMKGQIFDGMVFRTDHEHKRAALWHVDTVYEKTLNSQKTSENNPVSGESGESGEYGSSLPHDVAECVIMGDVHSATDIATHRGASSDSPDSPAPEDPYGADERAAMQSEDHDDDPDF